MNADLYIHTHLFSDNALLTNIQMNKKHTFYLMVYYHL